MTVKLQTEHETSVDSILPSDGRSHLEVSCWCFPISAIQQTLFLQEFAKAFSFYVHSVRKSVCSVCLADFWGPFITEGFLCETIFGFDSYIHTHTHISVPI